MWTSVSISGHGITKLQQALATNTRLDRDLFDESHPSQLPPRLYRDEFSPFLPRVESSTTTSERQRVHHIHPLDVDMADWGELDLGEAISDDEEEGEEDEEDEEH